MGRVRHDQATTTVAAIMQGCSAERAAGPDDDALSLLRRMGGAADGRLLVAERGRLLGSVTRKDLFACLAVKHDLEGGERGAMTSSLPDARPPSP